MDKFLTRLWEQAEENPLFAVGAAAAVITSIAKLADAASAAQGRRAFSKQVNHRVKASKKK